MKTKPRKFTRVPHGFYEEVVRKAVNTISRKFLYLNEYGNERSAETIRWMVENGKGLRAFAAYAPGTFEAEIRHDTEVWFRVRD
jgi:hypothetical protein